MRKYRVGQIVRKKTSSGVIGPWLHITKVEPDRVWCQVIGNPFSEHILLKANVYIYNTKRLIVSEDSYEKIRCGARSRVSHPKCIRWQNVYKNVPELICFYTQAKHYAVVAKCDNVIEKKNLEEDVIEVQISTIIGQI